jgi:acyl-CoA synthetase (NDP forming)
LITGSGGQAELILDVASAVGLSLPPLSEEGRREAGRVIGPITGDGNPLDAWGTGKYDVNMPHGLKVLADEPNIHSIVMVSDTRDDSPMVPTQYTPYLAEMSRNCDKPCFFMNTRPGLFRQEFADALRSAGIATIGGTRQGLGAIDRLARWSASLAAPRPDQPSTGRIAALLAKSGTDRASLNEIDAKSLLGEAGLPAVRERAFSGPDDVREAAAAIGYPLVLKVASDEIPHKSDLGLVAVGLADEESLIRAVDDMTGKIVALSPRPSDAVFVVQEMVRDGVELFMGVSRDPQFGPMLAFGLGGVLVEIFDDVALRPLPLRQGDAEAMIDETRAAKLLGAVRGQAPRDMDALCRCLYALGDFAWAERHSIEEIDLNPVMALSAGNGCKIVDALIIPRKEKS